MSLSVASPNYKASVTPCKHCLDDEEEQGFKRTNEAHDRLMRFETQVRRFIHERMTAAIGPQWIMQRVDPETRKRWEAKRTKAISAGGQEMPLIAYADFTDYLPIITRADNWRDVFKIIFTRTTLVEESFIRLYPIRICTMHSRMITQDDEMYLLAETTRLLKAMEVDLQ